MKRTVEFDELLEGFTGDADTEEVELTPEEIEWAIYEFYADPNEREIW